MAKKWCTLGDMDRLSLVQVLDDNDLLDALEEAEDEAYKKAESERKRGR